MKTQKSFYLIFLAGLLILSGCSTPASVARKEGHGTRRLYQVSYDAAWQTVQSISVQFDLHILDSDRNKGVITARRLMSEDTFGDSVAIFVRRVGVNQTEVEIVSRRQGPPVPFASNLEVWFHRAMVSILES